MGKKNRSIPDRWLDYQPVGLVIAGTKIVAFKVPLRRNVCQQHLREHEWFTPPMLLERQPKLKTVIDLTNTFRYYNGQEEFGTKGIDHVKIMVEGQGKIPTISQLQKFFDAMDHHMEKYKDNDALIGVHCTHGLNRTGYFVCRWMLERLKLTPDEAIQRFNSARGHNIEREHLLNDLRTRPPHHHHHHHYRNEDYSVPCYSYRNNSHYNLADQSVSNQNRGADWFYEGPSNTYRRNDNFVRQRNSSDWRRPGGGKFSRADLDTNWRARNHGDERERDGRRNFENYRINYSRGRNRRYKMEYNRSPLRRD